MSSSDVVETLADATQDNSVAEPRQTALLPEIIEIVSSPDAKMGQGLELPNSPSDNNTFNSVPSGGVPEVTEGNGTYQCDHQRGHIDAT